MSDDTNRKDCCDVYESDIAELRARMERAEQALVSVYERLAALEKAVANG